MAGFIFGGDTPWTYDELQRKRAVADSLLQGIGAPKDVGEGLSAIGKALAYRGITKRAGKEEARMRDEFDQKWGGVFSGDGGSMGAAPAYTPPGPPLPPPDPNSPHALGDDAMAALGKPKVSTGADPASIKAGLVARGLPEHIADGFVMNMEDESGLNPGINEANPVVPGSRGGFGLYQLTGPRRKAYEAFAAQNGLPLDSVDAQLDFLMSELQGPESAAWSKISGTKTAGEAGAAIVNLFLRPAEEHRASRAAKYTGAGGAPAPAGDSINLGSLVALASDPMISPAQKAIVEQLIQQQTTPPDPMKALELEKARLELDAMKNPTADPMKALELEKARLELEKMKTPERAKPYSNMGEIQADLQAGLITAEQAQVAVDKMGSGTTVNNNIDGGGKFEEAFAKGDAATIETVYNSGLAAERNIGRIDQLGALLEANPTGAGAAITQFAGSMGIPVEGLDEIQAAQALINSLVPEQRQPGSGPMSDADLALFKQSLPQIMNQPGGNKIIIDTMRSIAQYDAEGARIVQQLRSGEITRSQAFDALQKRVNPLGQATGIPAAPAAGNVTSSGVQWSIEP